MEKIILNFIKDFSNRNKRADYILDFRNNFICYKNCALYKADLRIFNYDYMIEHNIKVKDFTSILNTNEYEYTVKFDYIKKLNKINAYVFTYNDNNIYVDEKFIKLVKNDWINIRGISPISPIKFYDKNDNLLSLILPIRNVSC